MSKILITGGAGYIGSHTLLELINAGYTPIVVDNFSNSHPKVMDRLKEIAGKEIAYYEDDLRDEHAVDEIFKNNEIDAVIHFAGLKAPGESVAEPLIYYDNNIISTLVLCRVMLKYNVNKLVFSSSAAVYGDPETVPIKETASLHATNPYGQTKLMIEQILKDICISKGDFLVSCLRYFNPIGAHSSGKIGEDPNGIPNNLLPFVAQVAVGKLEKLGVFGNDYDTPDGTGVRDYIHVTDLAKGHLAALENITKYRNFETFNLGSGKGSSVFEVIRAFEEACGKTIPYRVAGRRPGDIATCYADVSKANLKLKWKTEKNLQQACEDAWNWQSRNPNGF